jgi:hypothetical protein
MVNPDPKFQDKQRYLRVRSVSQGSTCVIPPEALAQMVADDFSEDGEEYTTEDVWLTPHEYENLPEFEGW